MRVYVAAPMKSGVAGQRAPRSGRRPALGALSNVGIALFEPGRGSKRRSIREGAVAIGPAFVQAHSNRGNVLQRLKRPESRRRYRRAAPSSKGRRCGRLEQPRRLARARGTRRGGAAYRKALEAEHEQNPDMVDNLGLQTRTSTGWTRPRQTAHGAGDRAARRQDPSPRHRVRLLDLHRTRGRGGRDGARSRSAEQSTAST